MHFAPVGLTGVAGQRPGVFSIEKVARHGAGGRQPASSSRTAAAGPDGRWKPAHAVPRAGARLAATAPQSDLGDIAWLPVPSASLLGSSTVAEVKLSPGSNKLSVRGSYLSIY